VKKVGGKDGGFCYGWYGGGGCHAGWLCEQVWPS